MTKRKRPASHKLYIDWIERAGLERIENWAAKGCTMSEMAQNIGINRTTLYEWCKRFPDIEDAIKKGREMSCECVENALYRSALGLVNEMTTTKDVITRKDGSTETHERTTVTRPAPNVTAMIFYLKTRAGWSEKHGNAAYADARPVFVFEPVERNCGMSLDPPTPTIT